MFKELEYDEAHVFPQCRRCLCFVDYAVTMIILPEYT